jgi:hypothetical protein
LELLGAAEDTVEENIVGKTFQQKTRVMIQTDRRWMERRWSDRSWAGGEEDGSAGVILDTGDG